MASRAEERREAERRAKRLEFYAEMVDEPLEYLVHDANAHDDPALQDLRDEHGFGALGRYWMLMELLAGREGHRYRVGTDAGWRRLAGDMEWGRDDESVEACRGFMDLLVGLGLLSKAAYGECEVRSERVDRTASQAAKAYADKRYAAYVKHQKDRSGA